MKAVFIILFFFSYSIDVLACSCEIPKPALEFYASDYVFEGKAVSKTYAADSLTYTVKFEVLKHYKDEGEPKFMDYELPAEGEFTGRFTSCDWNVEVGEKWLVYSKPYKGMQSFSFNCSNSHPIINRFKVFPAEQKVLDNGNSIDLSNYRFVYLNAKPITNLDSILSIFNSKKLNLKSKTFAPIYIDVDKEGNLTQANMHPREKMELEVVDTIFGLNIPKNKFVEPRNRFEAVALEIANKIKKWEPYILYDKKVKYRTTLIFVLDENLEVTIYN
ncbi:hypothetical protein [Leeuwenhoekiella marinoflava]|uniref:hypothetical protein n=1 Tax=Leeuwenhoekiella marinoflava TaxID=988 RepID=UPI00300301BE